MNQKTHESAEDYLETILMLHEENDYVRSIDIVNKMGYKKSSVSVAMKNLRENGYITVNEHGFIDLTPEGRKIAVMIYERHKFFSDWLTGLGVDKVIAVDDACRVEHDLSEESFAAIKKFVNDYNKDKS